jgi:hypothetical protein
MSKSTRSKIDNSNQEVKSTDRKFWRVRIEPSEPKILGEHLPTGVLVTHNCGPGAVQVSTYYTDVFTDLGPDDTNLTVVRDFVKFSIIDSQPAIVEFEYLLAPNSRRGTN